MYIRGIPRLHRFVSQKVLDLDSDVFLLITTMYADIFRYFPPLFSQWTTIYNFIDRDREPICYLQLILKSYIRYDEISIN